MNSEFQIKVFEDNENHQEPFTEWLLSLNSVIRKRIFARIARLQVGNFGDCKQVGHRIFELRCFFGSGYRIYFGKEGNNIVILLSGGDKDSQKKDIRKAIQYRDKYNEQKDEKNK
jgi:putative addiction module killer protein